MENALEKAYVENSFYRTKKIFLSFSKKALFFTSLPFYWLIFFNNILNWFDARLFIFVLAASIVLSIFGQNWGVLNALIK